MFIRTDLSTEVQIVQAGHACLEAGFRFNKPEAQTHMVLCGAKDEKDLEKISRHLAMNDIDFEMFFEPDYDTGYTAIATEPLVGDRRKALKKFKLLKH